MKNSIKLYLPLVTLLASETVQMVDIVFGSHDHFKGRNGFTTSSTASRRAKHSIHPFQLKFPSLFRNLQSFE